MYQPLLQPLGLNCLRTKVRLTLRLHVQGFTSPLQLPFQPHGYLPPGCYPFESKYIMDSADNPLILEAYGIPPSGIPTSVSADYMQTTGLADSSA